MVSLSDYLKSAKNPLKIKSILNQIFFSWFKMFVFLFCFFTICSPLRIFGYVTVYVGYGETSVFVVRIHLKMGMKESPDCLLVPGDSAIARKSEGEGSRAEGHQGKARAGERKGDPATALHLGRKGSDTGHQGRPLQLSRWRSRAVEGPTGGHRAGVPGAFGAHGEREKQDGHNGSESSS